MPEEDEPNPLQVYAETTASQSNDDPNNAKITLVVRLKGKPVNFNYGLIFKEKPPARQGRYLHTSDWSKAPVTNGQVTIAMYPGKYQLTIRQQKEDSRGVIKRIELTANQNKIVKVDLEPLGQLTLDAEINGKVGPISAIISSPTGKIDKQQVAQTLTFNLSVGTYAATIENRTNPEELGYHNKGYTNNIQIAAGQEVLRQVKFRSSPAAKLKIEAYLDGKPVKPMISRFYGTSPPYPKVWASFEPVQRDFSVNLGAGAYEITVLLPPIANDKTVFPAATNLSQNRNLKFRPDEDRIEKFEFVTPGIGNLQVAAQVDGDSVRAGIKVRPSDATGNYFSATPATHDPLTGKANLKLRAGRYDIEVRPAKIGLNLGIDTFQGRSGSLTSTTYIAGIEPMIFKDVVIEPGKTIKLNAEFHQAKQQR